MSSSRTCGRILRSLTFALLVVMGGSCSHSEPIDWPELVGPSGSGQHPVTIDISVFEAVPDANLDQHASLTPGDNPMIDRLYRQWRSGNVLERHYPGTGNRK